MSKIVALCVLFVLVRAALPRMRFDQLVALCWKYLFPLAFALLLFTAALFVLLLRLQLASSAGVVDFSLLPLEASALGLPSVRPRRRKKNAREKTEGFPREILPTPAELAAPAGAAAPSEGQPRPSFGLNLHVRSERNPASFLELEATLCTGETPRLISRRLLPKGSLERQLLLLARKGTGGGPGPFRANAASQEPLHISEGKFAEAPWVSY